MIGALSLPRVSTTRESSLEASRTKADLACAAVGAWSRCAVLAVAVAGALVVGVLVGRSTVDHTAHVAGACIALEMAQAHGALEEPRRKRIIHSLTSVSNPHLDRFPVTRSAMLRACSDIRSAAWTGR